MSTPGHGGIRINKEVAFSNLTIDAINNGITQGDYIFFEEDCSWAIVAYEIPRLRESMFRHSNINESDREVHLLGILSSWERKYLLARGIEPITEKYFCEDCRSTINCTHQSQD